ncbi:MAG TPA: DinB family protein, partial [Acidimicrobiales bacterium]
PSDVATTLRSFPRRFRAALRPPGDSDEGRTDDALHRRPADGGLSAIEHAAWTATAIAQVNEAFRQVIIEDNPLIDLPPIDVPAPVEGGSDSVDAVDARVEAAGEPLANAIANVHGTEWTRTARVGDQQITALDVVRHAVRLGVEHLRAAELTVAQVVREGIHGG